jgi:transposase
MNHIAIDLGGRESQLCIRSSDGKVLEELRYPTRLLPRWLKTRERSRIILETCSESFPVADAALELGHEVRVVPSSLVKTLGVGARGIKTDRRDAQQLSAASCMIDLPSVHVPSQQARERKALCGMRDILVGSRTSLINSVRGYLRTLPRRTMRSGVASTFAQRVRQMYEAEPARPIPSYVERQLQAIEVLSQQIDDADKEIKQIAEGDPLCQRLMTAPGVGPVTSVRFAATVDRVDRFANAHQVESYLGLTPGEHSSSDGKHVLSITKAGPAAMRWLLVQAAWCIYRSRRPQRLQQWAREVEKRRGKRVAVVALARKLAGILYAMWRDGSDYKEDRSAVPIAAA